MSKPQQSRIESFTSIHRIQPRLCSARGRVATCIWVFCALLVAFCLPALAQQPASSVATTQQKAMQKLAFLVGHWSGPATVSQSQGSPLHLRQTEDVQYKLDGLVLLLEGTGRTADGKAAFRALATISYDDASDTYHFRAYNDGHYLDTELTVPDKGFSWSFTSGPMHITNTMHLNNKGQWDETSAMAFGGNPPQPSVEMLLNRQP